MSKPGKLDRSQLTRWSRFWLLWWQSPAPSVLTFILLMLILLLSAAGCSPLPTLRLPQQQASGQGYRVWLQCRPTLGLTMQPAGTLDPPHLTGL